MTQKLKGIGASAGISISKTYVLEQPDFHITQHSVSDIDAEKNKYQKALDLTITQLEKIKSIANDKLGSDKAEVFEAHIQIANDPEIKNEIWSTIETDKCNMDFIVNKIYDKYRDVFKAMEDPYFKERAADIVDVKKRILSNLLGINLPDIMAINQEVILVAHDLTPSETALLDRKFIKGFITEIGGRTSHAAIMARTMEIPAVLGVENILQKISNNLVIAINGNTGEIEVEPTYLIDWQNKKTAFEKEHEELKKYINVETKTLDGHKVHVESNVGKPMDAALALQYGAEGVGLYRSEFLYMDNDHWPTEDEQYEGYKAVLEKMGKKLVVVRTLDIGGDKKLSYFQFPVEMNPFLGWRAIRVSLAKPDIFRTQLRALGRASVHGKLGIMFPMIATIDEFLQAKKFTHDVFDELKQEGHTVSEDIQIGMMVEIPSSAALASQFAKHADFFSIGTNDLIQYTFACDRMSQNVAYLYQPNNPSLLNLIKMTIDGGHTNKRWVGMCGEMAGDPISIPLLLGLGLDAFSMSATSIPKARMVINNLNFHECQDLVTQALTMQTVKDVNDLVTKFLVARRLI